MRSRHWSRGLAESFSSAVLSGIRPLCRTRRRFGRGVHRTLTLSSAEEGEKRLEQIARQLEYDYASAARSLREGMKEMFTLQRLQIPAGLHKCLATTNLIKSPHSGVRRRTHNVSRWRDSGMVERWVASALLLTEKHFRRIDGHEHLWTLATILGRETTPTPQEKVAEE